MATSENVESGVGASISPSSSQSDNQSREPEPQPGIEFHGPTLLDDVPNIWDWGDLLSFADQNDSDPLDPARVRKRDPKMSCSNFLAGRVPCACPELDEMMMMKSEEEGYGHGKKKKKARTVRAPVGVYRCQVPACGADIKELKGYHRRHRVCLQCANASTVNIHGETKRYCQQCGKFHILPDFDEGKRSCRRKLERHNNRRRRKSSNSKTATGKESQGNIQREDIICDDRAGEENLENSCQIVEKKALNESEEGPVSPLPATPKDVLVDGIASLMAPSSDEIQLDGRNHKPIDSSIPSYFGKSAHSSACQTGRISFKLYDWNPAEFPRRLRHQIFEWLSSMPIELEGYIRPGCTILTVFIVMPKFMWMKLFEDPITHVHRLVVTPGGILSGKGNILVYLNNTSFHVVKGKTSMIKPEVKVRVPRLHYVHPTCFEAGKSMEFIVCGSNLLQAKFRFLLSFSGKYLAHCSFFTSSRFQAEGTTSNGFDHQLYRIRVPFMEADICGPVFIEVENEAGLSNFIAVLIADKATCSEMKIIQQRIEGSMLSEGSPLSSTASLSACEVLSQRKTVFPEAILDIAWLLKKPGSENLQQIMTTAQIQRFSSLLNCLITMESTIILEKILQNMKIVINKMEFNGASSGTNADSRQLEKYMDYAHDLLCQNPLRTRPDNFVPRDLVSEELQSDAPFCIQDLEKNCTFGMMEASTSNNGSITVPLLKAKAGSKPNFFTKECGRKLLGCSISGRTLYSRSSGAYFCFRPVLYAITIATVCLGICAVIFHPHVSEFAMSVRRCLLG